MLQQLNNLTLSNIAETDKEQNFTNSNENKDSNPEE